MFVVSSTIFDSLKEATDQLQEWMEETKLDRDARVYEIKETYAPKLKLVKEKNEN